MKEIDIICYKFGFIKGKLYTLENKDNKSIINELCYRLDELHFIIVDLVKKNKIGVDKNGREKNVFKKNY